jgi:hypothetical protein
VICVETRHMRIASGLMALSSAGPEKPQWHESHVEPITTGGNSSSTTRWNGVPRGTMDEVSS